MGPNLQIDTLKGELLAAINGAGLPISVINLVLSDLLGEVRRLEQEEIARERAEEEENAQGHNPNAGTDA